MTEEVILVDRFDNVIGSMQKMQAHVAGKLHRAFSVFIFNSKGELLLQQRAFDKYHSGGKWTNTCCSHPFPGEDTTVAAHRRLDEEMGIRCKLNYAFNFIYRAEVENELSEHEYDHVYFGKSDELPLPAAQEVAAYKYIGVDKLKKDMEEQPDEYTEWLKICFDQVMDTYQQILDA